MLTRKSSKTETPKTTTSKAAPRKSTKTKARFTSADPNRPLPAAPKSEWPRFVAVGLVGALLTTGLFLFLGWLQPTMSGNERISVSEVVKIDLAKPMKKKAPPPKPQEKPKKKVERKRKKAKSQPKKPSIVRKASTARSVRRSSTKPRVAPGVASSLKGLSGLPSGGAGGAGGVVLSMDVESEEVDAAAQEMAIYEQEQQITRDADQKTWESLIAGRKMVANPVMTRKVKPRYPMKARKEGKEGYVVIRILVNTEGKISKHEILDSDPPGVFEECIVESLPDWQYRPAKDNAGRPMEFWAEVQYDFELN